MRFLTGSPPSASVLIRTFVLSISQNFIWLSSPTAKKWFLVVSNCAMPLDFFLNPLYVLFIAPSLSFHSTRKESPSLLVPQENNLKFKRISCNFVHRHMNKELWKRNFFFPLNKIKRSFKPCESSFYLFPSSLYNIVVHHCPGAS